MKDYRTLHQPKKSLNTQFREDVIFIIIGCFIIYLFERFFNFLFSPLRTFSNEEIETQLEEKIEMKRDAREKRLKRIDKTETDPMYQFQSRFIEHPEDFENDPDNRAYKEWFMEWKKGNIIDSTLRWAPNIFICHEQMNPAFIEYMKIQLDLHKKASLIRRLQFNNTIFKYYPELSPGLKNLENDLANYEAEIVEHNMQEKLQDEIQKFGLPENIAEYLVHKDLNPSELKKVAEFMKRNLEKGISSEVCIYAHDQQLKDDAITAIHLITDGTGLPARVGHAFLRKEITIDETKELYEFMQHVMESYGNDIYSIPEGKNKTIYDDFIDTELNRYRKENRARTILK